MDPVYVVFWAVMATFACFLVGWALGWYRAIGIGVVSGAAALFLGWLWVLRMPTGVVTVLLAFGSAGLIWGAHHWRHCQPVTLFRFSGRVHWHSVRVSRYSWA